MITKRSLACAAALLGVGCDLPAMTVASHGVGQVLVFPYYTANLGQNTLITLVNSTDRTKAIKARFRESYNGRVAVSFNIYLSPHDTWVGAVFGLDGVVGVGSVDTSCTAPTFVAGPPSVSFPIAPFSTIFFTGAYADTGPVDINRLLEGHFEFFEMGEVSSDAHGFQTDIAHVNGVPHDCAAIAAAWNTGVWASGGNTDMSPPTGGLYGSSAIVDVSNGTYFALPPTVIDGFSATAQHTAPFESAPDFDTATAVDGSVAATVDVGGQLLQLHYADSVDAVSALLMTTQQMNEYEIDPTAGARTDWVATFPTKHFYVDSLHSQSPSLSPFEEFFGARSDGESCVDFELSIFDRDERTFTPYSCPWECPPPPEPRKPFCHETSVVQLSSKGSALRTNATEVFDPNAIFNAGHLMFSFGGWQSQGLIASTEGTVLTGLPAIGFVAENFVNANVTPGVLANYSVAIPHRSTVSCADGPCH
jgi:hypothetical protein